VKAVGGAMPPAVNCGAMLQDGDGVAIGVAKAPDMSRGGRCVRQDGMVIGAAAASSTAVVRCHRHHESVGAKPTKVVV
jgi:hypothetical protein